MVKKFPTIALDELKTRNLRDEDAYRRPVVLVVDDEHIIADTLVTILDGAGYVADAAYSGESALEMARIVPPDLLISDVVMPGMSGVSLAIALREICADCRVLLFSGQAATLDILDEARKHGHDFKIVAKPIHPRDLLAKASCLLDAAA